MQPHIALDPTSPDFGDDEYVYVDGCRHRQRYTRTLRPVGLETNAQFEARMDTLGQRLALMADVQTFRMTIQRKAGRAVECRIEVALAVPEPAPIHLDTHLAGGSVRARGQRASSGMRAHYSPA